MAGVAGMAWLHKGGIGVVNRTDSSSIWSWGIIFTLHWSKCELEHLDVLALVDFELLSLTIYQYWQNELSEGFI